MTEKDLHKLRRQDLLELLLSQSKEVLSLRNQIEQMKSEQSEQAALVEKLKGRLDQKDETIERLKLRLDEKDDLLQRAINGESVEPPAERDENQRADLRTLIERLERSVASFEQRLDGSHKD